MANIAEHKNKTRELLLKHFNDYPKLKAQDIFKFLFQSSFGCEHLVFDEETALNYIKREYSSLEGSQPPKTDALDGSYSRVYLSHLNEGLTPETLARIFCLSAKKEDNGRAMLEDKLSTAFELIGSGELLLNRQEFEKAHKEWRDLGYPAIHHSDSFREAYHPAYRVVSNRYASFLPIFCEIDRLLCKGKAVIAIEGGSASGKSTLAEIISEIYACNVFHMDDFFLRPEQRKPERFAEIGGNIDRERFYDEVLLPLTNGDEICYRPFDCASQTLKAPITVHPKGLTVIEGVYSMHPAFARYYDLGIFLDIDAEYQKKRILLRNSPAFAQRFFNEWIPLENRYFEKTEAKNRSDLIMPVK